MPTFKSKRRWSEARKQAVIRGLKRSWAPGGAHYIRFRNRPVDADTMRERALWDRKGRWASTFEAGPVYLLILHAKRRCDAYDVYCDGRVVCTGGKAKVGLFLGSKLP